MGYFPIQLISTVLFSTIIQKWRDRVNLVLFILIYSIQYNFLFAQRELCGYYEL